MLPVQEILLSLVIASFVWSVWRMALTGRLPWDAQPATRQIASSPFCSSELLGLGSGFS
jgi:hypothetical protein